MEARQYLHSFVSGWWIILSVLLLSTGAATLYSFLQTPVFEAAATFVALPAERISDTGDMVNSLDTLAGRSGLVATYCNVLQSKAMVEQGITTIGLPIATLEDYTVTCVVLPDSSIMRLTIEGSNPYIAADLANAIGAAGIAYVKTLQEIYVLRELDLAVADATMISPNHQLNISFGAVIGLLGGVGIVFVRHFLTYQLGIGAGSATTVPAKPVQNEQVIDAFQQALTQLGLENDLKSYLDQAGLGDIESRPADAYTGVSIRTLPNLRPELKQQIQELLERRTDK